MALSGGGTVSSPAGSPGRRYRAPRITARPSRPRHREVSDGNVPRLPRMRRPPRSLPARSDSGALAGHRPPESVIALRLAPRGCQAGESAAQPQLAAPVGDREVCSDIGFGDRETCAEIVPSPCRRTSGLACAIVSCQIRRRQNHAGERQSMAAGTSDRAPVALLVAVLLSFGMLAAAAAREPGALPVQWNGEGNGYGYDGDRHREERREMRREQEAEEVQRERWAGALGRTALGAPRLIAWRPRRRKGDRRSIAAIGRRIGCAGAPRSGNGPKSVSCR